MNNAHGWRKWLFELKNKELIKELKALDKRHTQELALLNEKVEFFHCPQCGKEPELLTWEDDCGYCQVVRVGCKCKEKIQIIFSYEEMKDMKPYWLQPYFMKFEVAKRWNEQVMEEMNHETDHI